MAAQSKTKSQIEWLFEHIKILHDSPSDAGRVMDLLRIENKKTLAVHRALLKKGFSFLGWKIQITNLRHGEYKVGRSAKPDDSTFHPLFFCLNMSELFVLLNALKDHDQAIARRLLALTIAQLSEYGKKKCLSKFPDLEGYGTLKIELKNFQEAELIPEFDLEVYCVKHDYDLCILLKSGEKIPRCTPLSYDWGSKELTVLIEGAERKISRSDIQAHKRMER